MCKKTEEELDEILERLDSIDPYWATKEWQRYSTDHPRLHKKLLERHKGKKDDQGGQTIL